MSAASGRCPRNADRGRAVSVRPLLGVFMSLVEVSEADNGRRIDVAVDDHLVVRLPENAGTGYVWHVESLSGPARLVVDRPEPAADAPGAAGQHRLELAFDGPGAVSLRAEHKRPWEPAAVGSYQLEVSVISS